MKISLWSIAACVGVASGKHVKTSPFKASSKAATNLLDKSGRKLEDKFDEAFVAQNSVVFQRCYNQTSWGENGPQTIGLVEFTLVPTDSCSSGSGNATGTYIVDLETFLDSYLEAQLDAIEYQCEMIRENCGCDGAEDDCLFYCYQDYDENDWSSCLYEQNEKARYGECERLEFNEDERRHLQEDEEEENVEYRMGPICGAGGTGIYLALYADDDCETAVEGGEAIYYSLAGAYHPNFPGGTSLVSNACISCKEPSDEEEENEDDREDEDEVIKMCEEIFNGAAKCETAAGGYYGDEGEYYEYTPNTNGCSFISQLQAGSSRRFLAAASMVSGSSSGNAYVWGAAAVLSVAAVLFVVKKKFHNSPEN